MKNVRSQYLSSQLRDSPAYARFVFSTTVDADGMFDSYVGIFALRCAILAAPIGRDPAGARSRAEHLDVLNPELDTWLDEP